MKMFCLLNVFAISPITAAIPPCEMVVRFEQDFQEAQPALVANPDMAHRFLEQAIAILNNPDCSEEHGSIRISAAGLARSCQEWPSLEWLSQASLAALPPVPADETSINARAFWLGEAAHAALQQATDVNTRQRAVASVNAFVAFASSMEARPAADPRRWLLPCAVAISRKADLFRSCGERAAAAVAEQQGSLLIIGYGLSRDEEQRLGGFAAEEFLQRAAGDLLAEGRVQDCVALISTIAAMPARVRPAAVHARVLVDAADKHGVLVSYVAALWQRLPHNGALVLLVNGSAVRAAVGQSDSGPLLPILDEILALPDSIFDEATLQRDERRSPDRIAADVPVRAHVMMNRAVLAATAGDFATTDNLLQGLESRRWLGDWCANQQRKIDFERLRVR